VSAEATAKASDPSRSSHYVNDAFYRDLIANFTDWQDDARAVSDLAARDECRRLLEREARLLDQLRYEDWLKMYAAECIYWVPSTPKAGDPRREVSVMFDDRRRLEDRIYRLRTGFAWSQAPASRTVRLITNVEVFTAATDDDVRMLRSNFLISEFWGNETRVLTGWAGHRVAREAPTLPSPASGGGSGRGNWKIQAKQVNLIDCDQCIRNPSIIL
jgi:3-phenylpropionate/cinnamic acid dioxygenase small subunit